MIFCAVCNKGIKEENYLKTYTSSFSQQEYKLYHCFICDVEFWWPLKIKEKLYEESEEYTLLSLPIDQHLESRHKIFFKYIPLRKGNLLDIGCGNGRFLEEAKKMGFNVFGVDLSKINIEYCKRRGLENVFHMSFNEFYELASKKNYAFDIITFFEVLEHQNDPQNFLLKVKGLLKPSGFLVGTVPNRSRFIFFKEINGRESFDFPPHHFFWFNEKSLEYLFKKNGFDVKISVENYNLKEMIATAERIISKKFGLKIRKFLKKKLISPQSQSLLKAENEKGKIKLILRILQKLRNVLFFLPGLFLFVFIKFLIPKERGAILFFTTYKPS